MPTSFFRLNGLRFEQQDTRNDLEAVVDAVVHFLP
jgi:hypothetical protein